MLFRSSGVRHELVEANLCVGIRNLGFVFDAFGTGHEALSALRHSILVLTHSGFALAVLVETTLTILVVVSALTVLVVVSALAVLVVVSALTVLVVISLLSLFLTIYMFLYASKTDLYHNKPIRFQ